MTKKIDFTKHIVTVQDFPKKGIAFKDWTPLMNDANAYRQLIDYFYSLIKNEKIDVIISAESRGFWIGCPLAYLKKCRFIPARKPNKLPRPVIRANYKLEYGINSIEISKGDIRPNDRVLVVDDIIATGGTVKAILGLIKKSKAKTVGCMFISEVPGTKGLEKIEKSGTKAYLAIK